MTITTIVSESATILQDSAVLTLTLVSGNTASGMIAQQVVEASDALASAQDAARFSANIYQDTAIGLAATVSGDYFMTLSAVAGEYAILYANAAGVAVEQKRFPTASAMAAAIAAAAAAAASEAATAADAIATAADAVATDADRIAAEAARDATYSAAQSSGVYIYDTKALATAAVAGLADLAIVEVLADESQSGSRTRYRKESGSLVFKIALEKFLQAGTGAVSRTAQDKMREVISILDFCSGNGVTDDSAKALQAVTEANARKCALFVPPFANVLISGSTTLNPKYGIFGGGRISRGVAGWTNSNPMILIDTDNQFVDEIKLIVNNDTAAMDGTIFFTPYSANIEIAGTPKNTRITNCLISGGRFGIWPYGADNIIIANNTIHTVSEAGIYIGKNTSYPKASGEGVVVNASIFGNRIYNVSNVPIGGSTGDGIKTTSNCTDIIIKGNHISGNRGDSIDCFVSGNRLSIIANTLFGNTVKGVDIKADATGYPPATWGESKSIIVSDNHIYGNTQMGISVAATSESVPAISIKGNHIHDNTYWGIVFDGYAGDIVGNLVYANGTYEQSYAAGIRVEGATGNHARDIVVANNICLNNGCSTGWTNSCGIALFGYVDNIVISGNVCSNVSYLPNSGVQDYGIYIPVLATNVKVVANKCTGNSVIGIGMANGADVSGEVLSINIGDMSATKLAFIGITKAQASVVRMKLIGSTSVTVDATNYWVFQVGKKSTSGSVNTYLASKNTATVAMTAFVSYEVASAPALIDAGESIFFRAEKFASASAISGLTAQIDLVTW